MKAYLAEVTTYLGDYKRTDKILVQASTEELANYYAIYCKSFTPEKLDWTKTQALELFGQFVYKSEATRVEESVLKYLEGFFTIATCNLDELMKSGNFPELGITDKA